MFFTGVQAAKFYHGAASQHLKSFVPALQLALKDINIQVKYNAERALKHLSEGGAAAAAAQVGAPFTAHLAAMDADSSRVLRDYLKRVVSRLPTDSDDEGNDKW